MRLTYALISLVFPFLSLGAEIDSTRMAERPRGRYVILEPEHTLTPEERTNLRAHGIEIRQALSRGRFVARVREDAELTHPAIRSTEAFDGERKMGRTARREAAAGHAFARLNVLFHDDVTLAEARAAIADAGGMTEEVFPLRFESPNRLRVRVPSTAVNDLASDERVLAVFGPAPVRIGVDNATSALLSNATPLHTGPYDLNGEGVVLSLFELGAADRSHREFGGRLNVNFSGGVDADHATHVAGTMIAAGVRPSAKGLAPAATLQQFRVCDECDWPADKENLLTSRGVVADNNSWGYILGWCSPAESSDCDGWVWTGNDDLYGGYMFLNAAVDKASRSNGVLMVHSSGNDGVKLGPTSKPFAHTHDGKDETFCYSEDGTGLDCAAPCSQGTEFCETKRHAVNAPWTSVGVIASTKNVLTVGATDVSRSVTSYSSRGPARDGRIKPEVMAFGNGVHSTYPGDRYATSSGTSMSTPAVTAIAGLLVQQWRKTFDAATPLPVALKTLIIAGAEDIGLPGPDYANGFGFVDAKASVDLIIADGAAGRRILVDSIGQGGQIEIPLIVPFAQNVRVVLGWNDPEVLLLNEDEIAGNTLVNDLDVKVVDATGTTTTLPWILDKANPAQGATRGVNTVDNTEMVEITNAAPGDYRIIVSGTRVSVGAPQQFVVVANSHIGTSAPPCADPSEPNDVPESAYGNLVTGQSVGARLCSAFDIDFFRFRVDREGPVSVTVNAADTPLRVSLSDGNTTLQTVDVPLRESRIVTAEHAVGTTTYIVKVEAAGTSGAGAYSITPTFNFVPRPHRRSVGR